MITAFKFCDPCWTDLKKKQPTLENPVVRHRQPEQEKWRMEMLPEPTVYIKKPNQVLVPQVTATGTGSAALEEPRLKKRDQEQVPKENPMEPLPDKAETEAAKMLMHTEDECKGDGCPEHAAVPAPKGRHIGVPAWNLGSTGSATALPSTAAVTGYSPPRFAIRNKENVWQVFYNGWEAIEAATLLGKEGIMVVTVYKLSPWRIVSEVTKTRIEPARKRKREV